MALDIPQELKCHKTDQPANVFMFFIYFVKLNYARGQTGMGKTMIPQELLVCFLFCFFGVNKECLDSDEVEFCHIALHVDPASLVSNILV